MGHSADRVQATRTAQQTPSLLASAALLNILRGQQPLRAICASGLRRARPRLPVQKYLYAEPAGALIESPSLRAPLLEFKFYRLLHLLVP